MEVYIHAFLTLALDGGGWLASRPGHFTPGTHWIGGWVEPRTGPEIKKTTSLPLPGIEARSSSPYWLSYPGSYVMCFWWF